MKPTFQFKISNETARVAADSSDLFLTALNLFYRQFVQRILQCDIENILRDRQQLLHQNLASSTKVLQTVGAIKPKEGADNNIQQSMSETVLPGSVKEVTSRSDAVSHNMNGSAVEGKSKNLSSSDGKAGGVESKKTSPSDGKAKDVESKNQKSKITDGKAKDVESKNQKSKITDGKAKDVESKSKKSSNADGKAKDVGAKKINDAGKDKVKEKKSGDSSGEKEKTSTTELGKKPDENKNF